jgi:hypothetical protein
MARETEKRYKTMEEFARDLHQAKDNLKPADPAVLGSRGAVGTTISRIQSLGRRFGVVLRSEGVRGAVGTMPPPSSVPAARHLRPEQIQFAFAGFGSVAPENLAGQNRLFLDVGNGLRAGVIDHHHQVQQTGSVARLVRNRPDLVKASVAFDLQADQPFTIVLHEHPDLDCVASTYLAIALLTTGQFPEGDDVLARYVDSVDEGSVGMSPRQPYSLYPAFRQLVERSGAGHANWREVVRKGMVLVDFAIQEAVRTQLSLLDVDAFACPEMFVDTERAVVADDRDRYVTKPRVARLELPGQLGDTVKIEALLARDVQNEGDPDRCLYFKDWARSDETRSPNHRGFDALSVFMSESPLQRRSCILSVTPRSLSSLRGLGALLDAAESRRRREEFGVDDRTIDPASGMPKPRRDGYDNSDPWYDGRSHGYTIVDAPRGGTLLTADEIEGIFLDFSQATQRVRPLDS